MCGLYKIELNKCGHADEGEISYIHWKDHRKIEENKCSECNKTFKSKQKLNSHMKYHKSVGKKSFDCTECDQIFTMRHELKVGFPV